MNFHCGKCKVLSIKHKESPFTMICFLLPYTITIWPKIFADSENDLGVHVNSNFDFKDHCKIILTSANYKYGRLKLNFHFVTVKQRIRVLYLSLVRSLKFRGLIAKKCLEVLIIR